MSNTTNQDSPLVQSLKARMIPFDFRDVTEPKDGYKLYKDSYWLCEDEEGKRALFISGHPFCNKDIRVLEWGMQNYIKCGIENVKPVLVPFAYLKIEP